MKPTFFQGWQLGEFPSTGTSSLSRVDLAKIIRFKELAEDYRVFAIPRTILTKREANAMGAWLAKELKIGLPNDREMFGTFQEWRDWLSVDKKGTSGVQKETHFYRRRSYMAGLADQIYPNFDLKALLAPPEHRARGRQYVPKGRQS